MGAQPSSSNQRMDTPKGEPEPTLKEVLRHIKRLEDQSAKRDRRLDEVMLALERQKPTTQRSALQKLDANTKRKRSYVEIIDDNDENEVYEDETYSDLPKQSKVHNGGDHEHPKRLKFEEHLSRPLVEKEPRINSLVKRAPSLAKHGRLHKRVGRKPRDRSPNTGEEYIFKVFPMSRFYFFYGTNLNKQPWGLPLSTLKAYIVPYSNMDEEAKYNFYDEAQSYQLPVWNDYWANDQKKGGSTCVFSKFRRCKSEWNNGPGYACKLCSEKRMRCTVLVKHGQTKMLVVMPNPSMEEEDE